MSVLASARLVGVKRLLAAEGASGSNSKDCAAAAGRVYEKLSSRIGPLLGAAGVRALFARSATLAGRELADVTGIGSLESSTTLTAFLEELAPAIAHQVAETLFETFLSLITTFIGERLTLQALRGAWPTLEDSAPRENQT